MSLSTARLHYCVLLYSCGFLSVSLRFLLNYRCSFFSPFTQVNVPDDHNATSGRSANKQVFEGLTTGLLRITAVIFRCLISSFPDGNNHSTALKIIQDVKSKSSQVEAFNSRIQDLIRLKKKILKCLYSSFITGKENYFNLRKIQTFLTLNV